MRKPKLFSFAFVVTAALAWGVSSCGGDDGALTSCPSSGRVCTNCSASGDCAITCGAGEQQFCGNFGFFDNPSQRCAFCSSDPDPFSASVAGSPFAP